MYDKIVSHWLFIKENFNYELKHKDDLKTVKH